MELTRLLASSRSPWLSYCTNQPLILFARLALSLYLLSLFYHHIYVLKTLLQSRELFVTLFFHQNLVVWHFCRNQCSKLRKLLSFFLKQNIEYHHFSAQDDVFYLVTPLVFVHIFICRLCGFPKFIICL